MDPSLLQRVDISVVPHIRCTSCHKVIGGWHDDYFDFIISGGVPDEFFSRRKINRPCCRSNIANPIIGPARGYYNEKLISGIKDMNLSSNGVAPPDVLGSMKTTILDTSYNKPQLMNITTRRSHKVGPITRPVNTVPTVSMPVASSAIIPSFSSIPPPGSVAIRNDLPDIPVNLTVKSIGGGLTSHPGFTAPIPVRNNPVAGMVGERYYKETLDAGEGYQVHRVTGWYQTS